MEKNSLLGLSQHGVKILVPIMYPFRDTRMRSLVYTWHVFVQLLHQNYHLELSGTSGASREVPGALEEFPFTTLTDGDLLIFPDSPRLTCKFYRGTSCRAVMPILRWSRQSCVKRPEYTVALRFT